MVAQRSAARYPGAGGEIGDPPVATTSDAERHTKAGGFRRVTRLIHGAEVLLGAHILTQVVFLVAFVTHIGLVLEHQLVDPDRLLDRMLGMTLRSGGRSGDRSIG